ncbi:MAG: RNA polymerase sporulation sigma factor SigK [Firmicutes bacterium]|nr:RNA polymerase sporulation sigma factor SigK [Bacillota bacterium]
MFSFDVLLSLFLTLLLSVSDGSSFLPPLSRDEEEALLARSTAGDAEARSLLIEHNLRLVSHIVRKYYSGNKNQDDLISIGSIGLIKAVDTFDPQNGARLATYASRCIQNEILMYFRSQKKLSAEISINDAIDTDRDGNPLTYADVISVEDNIAETIDRKIKSEKALEYIKKRLGERERKIMISRYGLDGGRAMTQREVAESLGISRSYVSRIEKSTLHEIYEYISGGV